MWGPIRRLRRHLRWKETVPGWRKWPWCVHVGHFRRLRCHLRLKEKEAGWRKCVHAGRMRHQPRPSNCASGRQGRRSRCRRHGAPSRETRRLRLAPGVSRGDPREHAVNGCPLRAAVQAPRPITAACGARRRRPAARCGWCRTRDRAGRRALRRHRRDRGRRASGWAAPCRGAGPGRRPSCWP